MNLREVREAAARLHNGWHSQSPKLLGDYETVCNFVLATIDPSSDEPITAKWLREEWNGKDYDSLWHIKGFTGSFYLDEEHKILVWRHVGVRTAEITTRQQFCDLARALGIPRRKDGAK